MTNRSTRRRTQLSEAYANRWEELMDMYSDMYKDVHGMRPRGSHLETYTEEDLEELIQQLHTGTGSGVRDDWNMTGNIPEGNMKVTRSRLRNMIAEEMGRAGRSNSKMPSLSSLLFEAESDPAAKTDKDAASKLKDLSVAKGPSDVVKFLNGPGADPRVRALIAAGDKDGDEKDEAASITVGSGKCADLIPTQVEIELTKSIGYPLAKFDLMKKMISGGVQKIGPAGNNMIVKSGNLIVDGHHRWSSLFSVAGPAGEIAAIDVTLPEKDAASVLAIVQTAIAATIKGPVPEAKAGGMNILGKSKEAIAGLIRKSYESGEGEAGPILSDDFVSKCLADAQVNKHFGLKDIVGPQKEKKEKNESYVRGSLLSEKKSKLGAKYEDRDKIGAARSKIIDVVATNLSQMKQPAEGAPPRVDMPQLDKAGGGVKGALEKLAAGAVNYKEPYSESRVRRNNDQVVLERWQKLAGIIKG